MTFETAEAWGVKVLRSLLDAPLLPRSLVNLNFPPVGPGEVQCAKVVSQGLRDYGGLKLVQGTDPRGYDYFWYGLRRVAHTPAADTDLEAIEQGYVTVTPLHLDLTHHESLEMLTGVYR